jgi:four helix bundle protein
VTSGEKNAVTEESKPKHYKDLIVWQRSIQLAKQIYLLTHRFPHDEKIGLTSFMRRTVVSIPSSIAKGQARHDTRDFLHHLSFADGSLAELETQLILGVELGFCSQPDIEALLKEIDELQRMIGSIARKVAFNSPLATKHSPLPGEE